MHPRIGVAVFITDNDGNIVIGRRKGSAGSGTWALPGGHLEFDESFEECGAREVLEETGIEVSGLRFLTATNDIMAVEGKHYVTVFMACTVGGGRERPVPMVLEPTKCDGWEWVKWEEMRAWAEAEAAGKPIEGRNVFLPMMNLVLQRPASDPIGLFDARNRSAD